MILAVVGTKQFVAGLRHYIYRLLLGLRRKYPDLELVSGGCRNVDTYAAEFALEHKCKITVYLPSTIEKNPYPRETIPVLRRLPREWVVEQPQYRDVDLYKIYHPFFERNDKVAYHCTHGLGFPLKGDSRGTLYTIGAIEKLGKPAKIYWAKQPGLDKAIQLTQESYTGMSFLDLFPHERRSGIANMFYRAVRGGFQDCGEIIKQVLIQAVEHHNYQDLVTVVRGYPEQAQKYAEYVLKWEKLPPDIKKQIKQTRAEQYRKHYMSSKEPTRPQLDCLARNGIDTRNITTRLQASELISQLRNNYSGRGVMDVG